MNTTTLIIVVAVIAVVVILGIRAGRERGTRVERRPPPEPKDLD